jgi:RNA recognition motif-containing protein
MLLQYPHLLTARPGLLYGYVIGKCSLIVTRRDAMSYSLFIDPLPRHFTSADLAALSRPFGHVLSAKVLCDSHGRSLQFGRVEMQSDEEAENACRHLHRTVFRHARLTVLRANDLNKAYAGRHPVSRPDRA